MEEFHGLASVVEVWRDVREDIEDPGQFPPALADVLRMADEYMTEVEHQEPINLAAPVSPVPGEHEFHEAGTTESAEAWAKAGGDLATEDGHSITDGAYLPSRARVEPRDRGLFAKYGVTRNDNTDLPGGKHYGCPLFVLDIRHDRHARVAARRYVQSVHRDEPRLADDLMVLVESEEPIQPGPDLSEPDVIVPVFSPDLSKVPLLPERRCGGTDPHHGHEWSDPVDCMARVWCVGKPRGSA